MLFHVLRIGHDWTTNINTIRSRGEVIEAPDYNAAADLWADRRMFDFSEHDHFDLVVMDPAGRHITLDLSMIVIPKMRLHEYQGLDG